MGSYDPFGYSKHKLWPKKRSGIKLTIWLLTVKSLESPWFTCVQVTCHILLEIYWWTLQLCFKPHLNWRFAQEVTTFQSVESLNFKNFGIRKLGSFRTKWHLDVASWLIIENTIRENVVASSKFGPWWVLWLLVVRLCTKNVLTMH